MALDVLPGTGLEEIQRGVLLSMISNLNAEIAAQTTNWAARDQELCSAKGIVYEPILLERVDTLNMHMGHRPSLLEAPINEYPNVSIMAWNAEQSQDVLDQLTSSGDQVIIELMVKSERGPVEDRDFMHRNEEIVNARCQRTSDAVFNVLQSDRTIGGRVAEVRGDPRVSLSDVFTRRDEGRTGDMWLWQGSRIEFGVERYASY